MNLADTKEPVMECGFTFFLILARLYDIDPLMGKKTGNDLDLSNQGHFSLSRDPFTLIASGVSSIVLSWSRFQIL